MDTATLPRVATQAARLWRGIEALEGMERRKRPGETGSISSMRRALSAAPTSPSRHC